MSSGLLELVELRFPLVDIFSEAARSSARDLGDLRLCSSTGPPLSPLGQWSSFNVGTLKSEGSIV